MIVGRRYWILIWYGILLLGMLGLGASLHWGRRTHWRNLLILLYPLPWSYAGLLGELLLGVALVAFGAAFILGRRAERARQLRRSGETVRPPE